MGEQQDVFEMSEEEFQAALSGAGTEETDETEGEEQNDIFDSDNTFDSDTDVSDQGFEANINEPETNAFESQESDQELETKFPEKHRIIHNGQEHYVTQEELINLAQKGYDYNQKTSKIAPHRRLIELIEEDEELKDKINQHVVGKYVPDVSKRDDYETEEEWLKDNLSKTVSKVSPFIDSGQETQQSESTDQSQASDQQEPEIITALRNRDPQSFNTVAPYMKKAITNLSVAQYQDIASDPQKVFQFYDLVKTKLSEAQQNQGQGQQTGQNVASRKSKSKNFNLRSGQGTNTQPGPKEKNVWEMNNKDFNALRQKSLGF